MRNSLWSTILVCALAMILLIGCVAPAPPPNSPSASTAAPPTTLQACVDFQGYPDDTGMGMTTFQVGGLTFTGLGTSEPFVNDYYVTADVKVHGLQFSDAGIQIDMSGPATTISLNAL